MVEHDVTNVTLLTYFPSRQLTKKEKKHHHSYAARVYFVLITLGF